MRLIARIEVRNAFIPPTALRMLRRRRSRRAVRIGCAPSARRRSARRRDARMGRGGAGTGDERVLGPDRMRPGVVGACAMIGVSRPGAIGGRAGP